MCNPCSVTHRKGFAVTQQPRKAKPDLIIAHLDRYLEETNQSFITPPEANALLAQEGILADSVHRPGLPLRRLLREGLIPYAYQKGQYWHIPHSSTGKVRPDDEHAEPKSSQESFAPPTASETARQLHEAQTRWQPAEIRCLLIAEAPPNNPHRYFYYADVRNHDHLFLGIMQALYPERKQRYVAEGRLVTLKKALLAQFQADGFFLMDLVEIPLTLFGATPKSALPSLLTRLEQTISRETPVIIIKASVFDICYKPLTAAGYTNVAPDRIPFPGSGNQTRFQIGFSQALSRLSLTPERKRNAYGFPRTEGHDI